MQNPRLIWRPSGHCSCTCTKRSRSTSPALPPCWWRWWQSPAPRRTQAAPLSLLAGQSGIACLLQLSKLLASSKNLVFIAPVLRPMLVACRATSGIHAADCSGRLWLHRAVMCDVCRSLKPAKHAAQTLQRYRRMQGLQPEDAGSSRPTAAPPGSLQQADLATEPEAVGQPAKAQQSAGGDLPPGQVAAESRQGRAASVPGQPELQGKHSE